MGVNFKAWLGRDPTQKLKDQKHEHELNLWWHRNFYPPINDVIADLHKIGLLPDGDYAIIIDW